MTEKTEWTDALRESVKNDYLAKNPTAENTTEILGIVAHDHNVSVNGLRAILTKAGVYVGKAKAGAAAGKTSTGSSTPKEGGKKMSKDEAFAALSKAIEAKGKEPDMDIISKLTGKAALYFADVLST